MISKSGDHVMLSAPVLTQYFTDSTGAPVQAATPFCAGAGSITSSTVTGPIVVTGGLDNGLPITGGAGTFTSSVNHCDSFAPFGNSSVTDITGTFTV